MATYGHTFTSGDTLTPTKLNAARTVSEIVNADVSATAAIAGTKIAPAFGAQNITVGTADRSITNTDNFALAFGTNNAERMRIYGNGVLRVGDPSSSSFQIDLGGTGAIETYRSATIVGDGSNMYFLNQQNGAMQFGTNNAERMRISSAGQVGIGTASPSYLLDVAGIVNTNANFAVDGTQVVGNRRTGWEAPTGNSSRATFDPSTVTLLGLGLRLHALLDDLAAHGLIDN
jgi:hypothetical protein